MKRPLEVIQPNLPVQAEPPRAGFPGQCPGDFQRSPGRETPQPFCASAQSITLLRTAYWCVSRTSCVPVYAHCLLSCHWTPLKIFWLHPLCTLPSCIYTHWWDSLLWADAFLAKSLSLFLYKRCSTPLIIFLALHWTLSNVSMSSLYWGVENWILYSRCSSPHWCSIEGNTHSVTVRVSSKLSENVRSSCLEGLPRCPSWLDSTLSQFSNLTWRPVIKTVTSWG